MATMDELIARVSEYLEKEAEGVELARQRQRTASGVPAWWMLLVPYYGGGLSPSISWVGDRPAARKLFLVKKYLHPKQGELFRCWLSENSEGASTYDHTLFWAEERGELRIVSVALGCLDCKGAGLSSGGSKCGACKGAGCKKQVGGWGSKEGFAVARPGKLLEVRRLSPPSDPDQLAHYNLVEKIYKPPAP